MNLSRGVRRISAVIALLSVGATAGTMLTASSTRTVALAADEGDAFRVGGPGHGGATAAERAYRDLLDHGPKAKILTAAHRAQWRKAPENSMPSIVHAFDDGAEIVELDIQLTKDRVPVLMHDTTVDRTTNGSGRVDSLTLAEIKRLRLKKGLGGAQAALTGEQVPTLAEALAVIKDRGLVNLDKGWPFREEIWQALVETDTVRNGIYKSDAPVADVQAFRESHPGAVYMHMVTDANMAVVDQFGEDQPVAYEVNFDSVADAVARSWFLDKVAARARVWHNTMWYGLPERMTDEASLIDPRRGWETLVRSYRTTIFQTDDTVALERWLRTGVGDPVPRGGVRVQAEDFRPGQDVGYHDNDAGNRSNLQLRPGEDVDIQDTDGAVSLGWLRGGEWLTYEVDVRTAGRYELALRASSPYDPAGAYTFSFDGGAESGPVAVENTTSHNKYALQPSGQVAELSAGKHIVKISLPADGYQNWNLDYLQLTPVR
ncbi:glycerophosphoryl diester phosphodiesterase [Nocardioides sp. YR527]|uniref:glycerophosphodiester phosphodiesterase family protein n=1 Tax=Nocardioides sp. YR527 TaxID=1881028 RepID=UPI0008847BDD|nr:glycerophosphodiester phosphodiesterase family protein [Nocardioides sp. YR527]SDL20954.1 glycerophosphoryl diester phosphodiesterase [Nocardioides sp. YR527]